MKLTKLQVLSLSLITTLVLFYVAINETNSEKIFNFSKKEKNIDIEENRTFWAFNYFRNEYYEVNSKLLATGDYCYIWMDEECIQKLGEEAVMSKSDKICNEFDNTIYPRVIDLAGHPNGSMGDIDGDPKIFILFLDSYNYYSEVNEIKYNVSNECEMFYINYMLYNHFWLYPTMTHEFHHLIWFNNEWDEPPFTLEALAQYVTYHAGYLDPYNNLVPQVAPYLPHPENSPLYWNDDSDYGSTYLFAFYIAEKYGDQILRDLITEPNDGPHGIETVLQKAGYNITFNELFINWITTLTIDELGFQNDLYGFKGLDARITNYEVVNKLPIINKTTSISHYAFHIYKLESLSDNFTITINKLPQQAIGISFAVHDSSGWQVKQNLHYEEESTIIDSFSGTLVDNIFIITSYISKNTPIAPEERGSGPSIDIDITLKEGTHDSENIVETTRARTGNIGPLLMILTLICIVLVKRLLLGECSQFTKRS